MFPVGELNSEFFLQVDDVHKLNVQTYGNPEGVPVVFLHGGPGGGITPDYRKFFDPNKFHVVFFDQRGCGKSEPFASLENNTTWDLVSDIEKIREHLEIDSWYVFGGSWGSTLALTYAIEHTERVNGLILRGIFMCRPEEIKWFYQQGASNLFPDTWETYKNVIPEAERTDFVSAYYKRLTSDDETIRNEAAKAWSQWEAATSHLRVDKEHIDAFEDPAAFLPFARIECHYFTNNAFFNSDSHILDHAEKLKDVPTWITHGRYDVVCPAKNAHDLKQKMPHAVLNIEPTSGHSIFEPEISERLLKYLEDVLRLHGDS
jgi:proline iminopeptidase